MNRSEYNGRTIIRYYQVFLKLPLLKILRADILKTPNIIGSISSLRPHCGRSEDPVEPLMISTTIRRSKKMSQHPSLRVDSVGIKHRNVLTRLERVKRLASQGKWDEGRSVYNLPKVKLLKIKVGKKAGGPPDKEEEAKKAGEAKGKK